MAWYCLDCFKEMTGQNEPGRMVTTHGVFDGHHSYCDECGKYDKLIEYMEPDEPEWSTEVPRTEGSYWMCGYVGQSGPFQCIRVDVVKWPRFYKYYVHLPNGDVNDVGVGLLEGRTLWQPMVTPDAPNLEDYLDQLPTAKLLWERRKR